MVAAIAFCQNSISSKQHLTKIVFHRMTLYCGTLPNQKTCRFDELANAFDQKAF
jgi:hypothetical protein